MNIVRGISIDGNFFVYGELDINNPNKIISNDRNGEKTVFKVNPDTITESTGMVDINSNIIFKGDIISENGEIIGNVFNI